MTTTAIVLHVVLFGQFGPAIPKAPAAGNRYGSAATAPDSAAKHSKGAPGAKAAPKKPEGEHSNQFIPTVPTEPKQAPAGAGNGGDNGLSNDTLFPKEKPPANDSGESLVDVPLGNESVPAFLVRRALTPPAEGALAGRSVTLTQLLGGKDPLQQRHIDLVRSYYRMCAAVADYHYALDEYKRLSKSAAAVQVEYPVLVTAIAAALARVQQVKLDAVLAQHELARQMKSPIDAPLPLPGDKPLVGPYRTYFKELYAKRGTSWTDARRAREINDTLPLGLDTIRETANSASSAKELLIETNRLYKAGQATPIDLLACHMQMREQRKAFVRAVRDYNLAIAEYALIVMPSGSQASSLLPMLVRRPAPQPYSNVFPAPGSAPAASSEAPVVTQPGIATTFETPSSENEKESGDGFTPVQRAAVAENAAEYPQPGILHLEQPQEPAKFSVPAEGEAKQLRSVVVPSRKHRP